MADETNIHSVAPAPNESDMRAFLARLFERADDGRVEMAWTSEHYPHAVNRARVFDLADIDSLVAAALVLNETPNRNIYVGAALRRPDMPHQRALTADVIAAVACKADCDHAGGLEEALRRAQALSIPPNIVVLTGRQPHARGQLWWLLERPCAPAEAEALDRQLAAKLGTDSKVTNPDRLMRLPGTIAWPLKEGRTLELTGIAPGYTRTDAYTLDELRAALPEAAPAPNVVSLNEAPRTLDLTSMIARARLPGEWHQNMLLATAHLHSRQVPHDVILDMLTPLACQPGYTHEQTRQELAVMIVGAGRKWAVPVAPSLEADENPFFTIARLLERPPPEYLVDGYLLEQGTSVLFGAPGSFKSFIGLDLALCAAHGIDWHGRKVKRATPTLYICAEGQYSFGVRGLVWETHRLPEGHPPGIFHVLPQPVNFLEPVNVDALCKLIDVHLAGAAGFVILDTLARNFGAGDENSAQDMGRFVHGLGAIQARFGGHVMVVHHTGKDSAKDERGSIALRGAVDTSLKLEREDGARRVKLIVRKQKEGPEAAPAWLDMVIAEAVHPLTGEIVTSMVPLLNAEMEARPRGEAQGDVERLIITLLTAASSLTQSELVSRSGRNKGTVYRALQSLLDKQIAGCTQDAPRVYFLKDDE